MNIKMFQTIFPTFKSYLQCLLSQILSSTIYIHAVLYVCIFTNLHACMSWKINLFKIDQEGTKPGGGGDKCI